MLGGASSATSSSSVNESLLIAHAVLLGIAFVFMYPIGMILLRLQSRFTGFWAHAIWQFTTTVAVIAGFAIALTFSLSSSEYSSLNQGHQILGIVVVAALLAFQPLLGLIHHIRNKRVGGRHTVFGWLHLSLGRVLILAGMVNTCL